MTLRISTFVCWCTCCCSWSGHSRGSTWQCVTMKCDWMRPKQVWSNELVLSQKICRFGVIRRAIQAIIESTGASELSHKYFYHFFRLKILILNFLSDWISFQMYFSTFFMLFVPISMSMPGKKIVFLLTGKSVFPANCSEWCFMCVYDQYGNFGRKMPTFPIPFRIPKCFNFFLLSSI